MGPYENVKKTLQTRIKSLQDEVNGKLADRRKHQEEITNINNILPGLQHDLQDHKVALSLVEEREKDEQKSNND